MTKTTKNPNTNRLQLPSMLSFERKLEPSDGLMYSGNWDDVPTFEELKIEDETERTKKIKEREANQRKLWNKIEITPRFNRSTQSAEGIDDKKKVEPNPVSSGNDDATLLLGNDTLKLSFTLRIVGNLGEPYACNDFTFGSTIKKCVQQFKDDENEGIETLAFRYAYNIANGRFLWRNRVGAKDITIHIFNDDPKSKPLEFKAYDYALKDFDKNCDCENVKALAIIIRKGLLSDNDFTFIKVDTYVNIGLNQHVFPSEEMNMNEKGKTLFQLNGCAAMHNVKIGNAIRTIDDWYDNNVLIKSTKTNKSGKAEDEVKPDTITDKQRRPIAIEPYGSVTQWGCAYRAKDEDLYTLIINWVNGGELKQEDKNYVVANLIRGGVFSRSK
ncbi:MAG TPA: type I-F CRISPR-associated protein Csy3 [Aeromonadales bacterium]|nr:type I-F CRISPR-associated protein Csy3 [Aeromonadales bacterium]